MILWLLACKAPDEPAPPPQQDPIETGDTDPVVQPELRSPLEAIDLDPAPNVLEVELTAAPFTWSAGGTLIDGLAFNSQVPGPTLRAQLGDTLRVQFRNELDADSSIHWHGLSVPFAMDGAGWQANPVGPGESFTYSFELLQAGTFWYHPHFNTDHQVDRGLYGVLVVEDPADPPVDEDLVVVFDSAGEVERGALDPTVDPSPDRWMLNGQVEPVWRPESGKTVRLRVLNVSNAGYVGLTGTVLANDQGLLAAEGAEVILAPGDRADLEIPVGQEPRSWQTPRVSLAGTSPGTLPLFSMVPSGSAPAPSPLTWAYSGLAPTPDPGHTDLFYTFTGTAENGWEINGQSWPSITPDSVSMGTDLLLEIRNLSPSHHPYHLHGMVFEVLSIDGVPPVFRRFEDTLDVGIRQVVRLRILADNPGDWMSHCHILPHAEGGMMTVLSVQP